MPPFYVGQKIVAIENQKDGDFKKGALFIVRGLEMCHKCKRWYIDIGRVIHTTNDGFEDICHCGDSKIIYSKSMPEWYSSKLFAPIQESFQSITLEKVLEIETPLISVN